MNIFTCVLLAALAVEEMLSSAADLGNGDAKRRDPRTLAHCAQRAGAGVKTMDDGFMASFGSATSAMKCAIAPQRALVLHAPFDLPQIRPCLTDPKMAERTSDPMAAAEAELRRILPGVPIDQNTASSSRSGMRRPEGHCRGDWLVAAAAAVPRTISSGNVHER
jgi:hypothetical protein